MFGVLLVICKHTKKRSIILTLLLCLRYLFLGAVPLLPFHFVTRVSPDHVCPLVE